MRARSFSHVGITVRDFNEFVRLSGVLKEHCEREGRDYGAIEKTVLFTFQSVRSSVKVPPLLRSRSWKL